MMSYEGVYPKWSLAFYCLAGGNMVSAMNMFELLETDSGTCTAVTGTWVWGTPTLIREPPLMVRSWLVVIELE